MKKILLALVAIPALAQPSFCQTTNTFPADGKVGIGTTSPGAKLTVTGGTENTSGIQTGFPGIADFSGSFSRSRVAIGNTGGMSSAITLYGTTSSNALQNNWEIGNALSFGSNDLYFFSGTLNGAPLYIGGNGNIGVSNTSPISTFQVEDGCSKTSIGEAAGETLHWGTSYLGFNSAKTPSGWVSSGDGVNNGGGMMYSSIFGDMYFVPITRTGGADQTLADVDIVNRVALHIDRYGTTYAKKIVVQTTAFPDYVFSKSYPLMPLAKVKNYIDQNHHLPDMPSAAKVEKDGVDLNEVNSMLVKKVEELTLYLIEKDRENKRYEARLKKLEFQFKKHNRSVR